MMHASMKQTIACARHFRCSVLLYKVAYIACAWLHSLLSAANCLTVTLAVVEVLTYRFCAKDVKRRTAIQYDGCLFSVFIPTTDARGRMLGLIAPICVVGDTW